MQFKKINRLRPQTTRPQFPLLRQRLPANLFSVPARRRILSLFSRVVAEGLPGRGAHSAPPGVTTSFRPPRFRNVSGTAETLTYYAFPDCHWIKIRTNNPLERIMREMRRRTRVVGAFPDGQSCLNLAAARLRHIAGTPVVNPQVRFGPPKPKPTEPPPRERKCERVWTLPPVEPVRPQPDVHAVHPHVDPLDRQLNGTRLRRSRSAQPQ
jgi:hypothetical protein